MSSITDNHPAVPAPRRAQGPIVTMIPEFAPNRSPHTPTSSATASGPAEPVDPPPTTPPVDVQVVLRLIVEVVTGRRPSAQLAGLITRSVQRYVAAEINRPDRRPDRRRTSAARGSAAVNRGPLRGVRLCQPAVGVAEVSAVWRHEGRYRALAARFECRRDTGAWVCTVLRLG